MNSNVSKIASLDGASIRAENLAFSDTSHVPPRPEWAVGQVSRADDLDVLPGFRSPPKGFGLVPFYWWLGDPLTKERIAWQLAQMEGVPVSGYQINYAHSDKGEWVQFGLTLPSEPRLFSPEWWHLAGWFIQNNRKAGIAMSLSDYTLGAGQGWCVDEILREHPEIGGMELHLVNGPSSQEALASTKVADVEGKMRQISVCAVRVPLSINPMHPLSGPLYAKKFFGQFEEHFPDECGKGLNFFFSDELTFGVKGFLWVERFAEEFHRRKGYDILPELPALFVDIGPRTPKIRLDYSDVMVALSEENFFKPVFDWHEQRGMTMGCDHGGRGYDVAEFGDYFRTQRWNQGPGSDQPQLGKDLIRAKVASSIAHLYQRPRTWLEGFYGSGWGTTSANIVDATLAGLVMGYNLFSLHGMYYSTHGGWWEWAPPDNTFRMPYWKHLGGFMNCVERLSYLLSQGCHRCDVAILYPVAPVEANMGGREAVDAAFSTARQIYAHSIDFDFMDFESLDRARVVGNELHVSGEVYRVLVLPGMKAARHSTLQKALEFHRAGGVVLAVGALPEASDRIGREDPEITAMVNEMFPNGAVDDIVPELPPRDYEGPGYIQHRKIGSRDLYAIYNAPKDTACFFRATGRVELWDPWTGEIRPWKITGQNSDGTRLKLPLSENEIQLIVFVPGEPEWEKTVSSEAHRVIPLDGDWDFQLQPTCDNRFGDFRWPAFEGMIGAEMRQMKYARETDASIDWMTAHLDDSKWKQVTYSYGPKFWKLGPLSESAGVEELEAKLASLKEVNLSDAVDFNGTTYGWEPYEFSWRFGIENDTAHQGYHGLKAGISDEFIGLGAIERPHASSPNTLRVKEEAGSRYYLWTTVQAPHACTAQILCGGMKPTSVWLNHQKREDWPQTVELDAGANPVLLKYEEVGRGYFVFHVGQWAGLPDEEIVREGEQLAFRTSELAMNWWNNDDVLKFDVSPHEQEPVGWYRFDSPPALQGMTVTARGRIQVWINGKEARGVEREPERGGDHSEGAMTFHVRIDQPQDTSVKVAFRVSQARGCYGGATFPEPILMDCGSGKIQLGDWSEIDGLSSYSGAAKYSIRFALTKDEAGRQGVLDLGDVAASAEIRLNGNMAGTMVAPPWKIGVTDHLRVGENKLEVTICNTLANHYETIPTNYRGNPRSGLMGPVRLILV